MTDRAAEPEETQEVPLSLWVVLTRDHHSDCFELDGRRCRAIAIGNAEDAAIRLHDQCVAPVECYLERDGDEVWLIPGYRTSALRVDATVVASPTRLWRRCVLHIAGTRFELRIREEPPTAPDNEVPTRRFDSNAAADSWDTVNDGQQPEGKQVNCADPLSDAACPRFEGIDLQPGDGFPELDGFGAQPADFCPRLESIDLQSGGFCPSREGTEEFERISVRPIVAIDEPAAPHPRTGSVTGQVLQCRAQAIESSEAPPSSMSPTITSVRGLARGPAQQLELLGILAQRRPWIVMLGVVFGASTITAMLHLGSHVVHVLPVRRDAGNVAMAAPFLRSMMPFCSVSVSSSAPRNATRTSRRTSCRWLPASPASRSPGATDPATDSSDP